MTSGGDKKSSTPGTLDECTKENTPKWNFNGLSSTGKVVSIYDGDTITVAFNTFGLGFFQHNMRLLGIDSPEIHGKTPEEKAAAIAARDYLRGLILGKIVTFSVTATDKYGRLLTHVHLGDMDISAEMLKSGHAKPYDGGTREPFVA